MSNRLCAHCGHLEAGHGQTLARAPVCVAYGEIDGARCACPGFLAPGEGFAERDTDPDMTRDREEGSNDR